jgi:nucleoside-diphosphate-sugar epimerase
MTRRESGRTRICATQKASFHSCVQMTNGSLQREGAAPRRRLGRVLVTGANGFIGAALVDRLRHDGEEVVASDLERGGAASAHFQGCDITDPRQVETLFAHGPFETIFHSGAVSGPMVMPDRPLEIWRINALGTAHLLEAGRRHRAGRFILCSSCSIYGEMDGATINEATPPDPLGVYGASKVAAEQAMIGFAREYGVDAIALRLAWVYGPGRRTPTTLAQLLQAATAGRAFVIDDAPSTVTHYVHVEDVIEGLLGAAWARNLPRLVYNISAGPGARFDDLAALVCQLASGVAVTFARGENANTGPLRFDLANAARDLGYRPSISLKDGLERYLAALRTSA